ncbi:MAG TPA: hypothetical protein VNP91_13530 [Methylomirabilota bacterium]|nr:hypothetical protein [Methylomirabilota bacterium]
MATCSAGPRCKIVCAGGCGCVYVYEEDTCTCECFDSNVGGKNLSLSLGSKIDVSVKGLPLAQLAARFDRLLAREVLVPASRTRQKVSLQLERVSFATALKTLGLQTRTPTKRRKRAR